MIKKIPKIIWIPLALIAAVYAAWSIAYPSGTWRYKMTVVVETPEGVKTGSAVREVSAYTYPQLFLTNMGHVSVSKGEAVVVDLGQRGILFALMTGGMRGADYGHAVVYHVFPFPGRAAAETTPETVRYYRSLKNAKATLTPEQYPKLVYFRDPQDPKTVETAQDNVQCPAPVEVCRGRTKGYAALQTMEKAFGEGVRIKEITVEMTDEEVMWKISNFLPSFGPETGFMKWFQSLPYGDGRRIGPYNFKTGEKL